MRPTRFVDTAVTAARVGAAVVLLVFARLLGADEDEHGAWVQRRRADRTDRGR